MKNRPEETEGNRGGGAIRATILSLLALLVMAVVGLQFRAIGPESSPAENQSRASMTQPAPQTRPEPVSLTDDEASEPGSPGVEVVPASRNGTRRTAPQAAEPASPVSFADGEAAYHEGRYAEAARILAAHLAGEPEHAWGHYLHGLALWKAGRTEDAEVALQEVLKRDPDHVKSLLNLGRVRLALGRADDALAPVERAIEIDPAAAEAYRVLGRVQHGRGLRAEAIDAYHEAIARNDRDVWALNNLGLALIEAGRFDEALAPLARASVLGGDVARIQNNLGAALERTGHYAAATEAYARAVAADTSYRKAVASLARVRSLEEAPGLDPIDLIALAERFGASKSLLVASDTTSADTIGMEEPFRLSDTEEAPAGDSILAEEGANQD